MGNIPKRVSIPPRLPYQPRQPIAPRPPIAPRVLGVPRGKYELRPNVVESSLVASVELDEEMSINEGTQLEQIPSAKLDESQ